MPPGAIPAERVREAAERVLADEALQRALPKPTPPPVAFDIPEPLVLLLKLLLAAAVLVAVVLAAVWLVRRLRPGARDVAPEDATASAGAPLAIPILRAQALAAAGRYAEAIHLLLLETLEALSRASRLAPSLTSREVVARVALPDRARHALADLVMAVEISRFGGAQAGQDEYGLCLARFHEFQSSYRGAA
jgi:hypothetical protein